MSIERMKAQMSDKAGFIAALDQSGGSTPKALAHYGIPETAYSTDEQMFGLMHDMRVRIVTAPSFTGDKVIAAILFERTMDGHVGDTPVPTYLWRERGVVPLLKIDKGLEAEQDGVTLMKPMPGLDDLLARAVKLGVYGTKERSTIATANPAGIKAIVDQQFAIARQVAAHGLVPIMEPEVLIKNPQKAEAEAILAEEVLKSLDALPGNYPVMLKVTIPEQADLYAPIMKHPRMQRVVALSGGYPLDVACQKLKANHGMIASFSRALVGDLRVSMSDAEFDATLSKAVEEIYDASVNKI
ncbi:fructose-1,6-bisphosphate aldolase [Ameyamaea chiangmaiensis NBRC 103196]|uniref:fructose-bisphosphate aldolase n=1 Tax=Ameyamaea chiangmaiensis TaxID=442969 RepID=A0A850PGL5_9PROT|nr:fructose bisphosphate aldolase [Ameyamaea chiangmaiensis]MBS4074721.1 fructose bisphosphate aldolase [Ameyamaea chiangmaiensis]NVN41789.1 fructose bisphosphate aldolase [Ameyamaea chiangmaiensis]GBQ62490.1 fructose-1,6-bisphosphate aldolase [Ameyamaea chiangmaiensis NBRC 103196]